MLGKRKANVLAEEIGEIKKVVSKVDEVVDGLNKLNQKVSQLDAQYQYLGRIVATKREEEPELPQPMSEESKELPGDEVVVKLDKILNNQKVMKMTLGRIEKKK